MSQKGEEMPRAVYIVQRNLTWLQAIKDLRDKLLPIAVVADESVAERYVEELPGITVYSTNGCEVWPLQSVHQPDFSDDEFSLPASTRQMLTLMKSMDRYYAMEEGGCDERFDTITDLGQLWSHFLDSAHPDILVFQNVPFHTAHLALYYEAWARNIVCLIGRNVNFPFSGILQFTTEIGGDPLRLFPIELSVGGAALRDAKNSVDDLVENYSRSPDDLTPPQYRLEKERFFKAEVEKRAPALSAGLRTCKAKISAYETVYFLLKRLGNVKPWFGKRPNVGNDCYARRKSQKALFASYSKNSSSVDFQLSYIYFPLQYQPERSSIPDAEIFGYQLYALRVVAAAIPDNWYIYVKEHPGQFDYVNKGNRGRNLEIYKRIAKMPKCRLVDLEVSSMKLIDHSRAVVTPNGSASVEAVLRGKKGITLAKSNVAEFPFVKSSDSPSSLKKELMKTGSEADRDIEEIKSWLIKLQVEHGRIEDPAPAVSRAVDQLQDRGSFV